MSEHFFVCSGNRSLVSSMYDLFRPNAPGASVGQYQADAAGLQGKAAELKNDAFGGKQYLGMGKEVGSKLSVGDVLGAMAAHASREIHVFHAKLDGEMIVRMHMIYGELLKQAIGQGIMPFPMFTTPDSAAAQSVLSSLAKSR